MNSSSESEAELLARCRRGEAAAWDELFDRHYGASGRFIFQLGHDFTREDAEEICQEVFLSVIKNLNPKTVSSRLSKCLDRLEEIARKMFSGEKTPALPSNL